MTVNRGPGVAVNAGVGTTTLEHRLQIAGQYAENAPGVPRSGVLVQSTELLVTGKGTMAYDIGPCALVIGRTAGEGVYTPTLTGTTTVATTAAPASNSRWDLIYVKQNDVTKGDADNLAVVGVIQGPSGATPSKPYGTVPAGGYVLAEAQIFSGSTGTSGGTNTISQVWSHTAARGAALRVRDTTERDVLTPYEGMQIVRLDQSGTIEVYGGGAWAGSGSTAITTFGAGWTALAGAHQPRLYRSGAMVHLIGAMTIGATGNVNNMLTVPAAFRPANANTTFVGSGVSSSGAVYELALSAGVLAVPSGYLTGSITNGVAVPIKASWPLY